MLRVVRGTPSDEELAALIVVLAALRASDTGSARRPGATRPLVRPGRPDARAAAPRPGRLAGLGLATLSCRIG